MSSKQSSIELTKWSIIFVFLWTYTEVKGHPCVKEPCAYTSQGEDGSTLNLNSHWVIAQGTHESITLAKEDVENKTAYFTQITEELGFFDNISKQPLKIILVVGLSLALLIMSIAIIRKCYKCYWGLSEVNQAYAMIIRIGKSQHMS